MAPSDVVFKEWCTIVLILPMQERSRESTVLFGQWPKTKPKQKLENKRSEKNKNINNKNC